MHSRHGNLPPQVHGPPLEVLVCIERPAASPHALEALLQSAEAPPAVAQDERGALYI